MWEPHVAPLNALVEGWRASSGRTARQVPWFDPDGGGNEAGVLLLMESPGPATVAAGDVGFSSEDNDDPTARRLRRLRIESGLARDAYVRWNVVPWALHAADGRRRAPTTADLDEAAPTLTALVDALPRLRVTVTFGSAALQGWMRLLTLPNPVAGGDLVPTLAVPHPSPANGHRRAVAEARTRTALARAAALARDDRHGRRGPAAPDPARPDPDQPRPGRAHEEDR